MVNIKNERCRREQVTQKSAFNHIFITLFSVQKWFRKQSLSFWESNSFFVYYSQMKVKDCFNRYWGETDLENVSMNKWLLQVSERKSGQKTIFNWRIQESNQILYF